jgi:pimeloyl-ACP methyl ester carboxylesterase
MYLPLAFLLGTLASVFSVCLLAGGIYVLYAWTTGTLVGTAWLAGSIGMLVWSVFGRFIVLAFYRRGEDEPGVLPNDPGRKIQAPDGSILHVETDGAPDKPVIILTHGWGLDSSAWYSVRKRLSADYRLVLWDLPGLGRSSQPADGRYSVTRLAEDLRRVIDEVGKRPVTLVGHSIGGMMILTLCRLHPDLPGRKINGIVLIDTTHEWPLDTVVAGGLLRALRWPVLEPLLVLTILLSPLVWLQNAMSYINGTSHIVNRLTSLSSGVTRGQLDFAARFNVKDKPSVVAKGLRAVMRWNEAATPARIIVPTRVVAGDVDRLTLPEAGVRMSEMIKGADFVKITPAGHNGLIEQGGQYADAIAQLVQRVVTTNAARQTESKP